MLLTALCVAMGASAASVTAQGLSGALIRGQVTRSDETPASDAVVTATDTRTGVERQTRADASGRYQFASLVPGSYRLLARSADLLSSAMDSIPVHLGDVHIVNLKLQSASAALLGTVAVRADAASLSTPDGPQARISQELIERLPLLNRDFVGLLGSTSLSTGPNALWISGQHARFNAIQLDGAVSSDLFGVNLSAGSGAGGKPISLEALEEVRVLVAPFDVRQGGFSGGLINGITRSGTNTLKASMFSSFARSEFVGADTAGNVLPTFDQAQFGGSIGGPLVRNRLHYFVAGEWQTRSARVTEIPVTDSQSVVTEVTVDRIRNAVQEKFGFDPGGAISPQQHQPNGTLFTKLSWTPTLRHSFELSATATRARSEVLNRTSTASSVIDGWQLSGSGSTTMSSTQGVRLRILSAYNRVDNEALFGLRATRDNVYSRTTSPLFLVGADRSQNYVAAGSVKGAQQTDTDQRVLELTDNLSLRSGAHTITVGSQNVFVRVSDTFFLGGWGLWTFGSVDSLEQGLPNYYEVAQPREGRKGRPTTAYNSALLSLYAQDQWFPHPRVQVSFGVRAEMAHHDRPRQNVALAQNPDFGFINTSDMPRARPSVAPRIGMSWTVRPNTALRLGVGQFVGRTPYAWLGNAYAHTGLEQETLTCDVAKGVPLPTADIRNLPAACRNGNGLARPAIASFDRNFESQRATKYVFGVNHVFTPGFSGTLDAVHTRTRHALFITDLNLQTAKPNAEGRMMYGTPTQRGSGAARLDTDSVDAVYRFSNVDGERSTALSLAVQRQWTNGAVLQVNYQWSRTFDVMSLAGFNGPIFLRNNPVDGSLSHRNVRRSARDIPHTASITLVAPLTESVTGALFLRARSGTPFALTTTGDANGDGVQRNDLLYIPRDSGDLSLGVPAHYGALNAWIERQPCVRSQRGRIMQRNSCRNPSVSTIDARLSKHLKFGRSGGFELSADFFNVANLLNRNWGLVRESTGTEFLPTLNVVRADAARNRVVYSVATDIDGQPALPPIHRVATDASRWRMQVGARFTY